MIKNKFFTIIVLIACQISSLCAMDHNNQDENKAGIIIQRIPTGSMLPFAGAAEPEGWLMCDGRIVSRVQYQNLFNVIGRTYNLPPSQNQVPISNDLFYIPDMRGRVPVGVDKDTRPNFGTSSRVTSNNTLGASGGTENVTLAINQIPIHDHIVKCSPQTQLGGPYPGDILVPNGSPRATQNRNTDSTGGSQPHNNMPPYLVLNYIIKY